MISGELIPAGLANHLWQSTLFAIGAALLALALRRNRAQIRYVLWLIASLKFLIPFSLLMAVGSYFKWPAAAVAARPAVSAAIRQFGQPLIVPDVFTSTSQTTTSVHTGAIILLLIWSCGFLAVLAAWLLRWRRVRASLRNAVPQPFGAPIKILSSPSLLEPGVFGIFRPVLVLPEGITGHLTAAHLDAILAHELCHVRRRDNLAAALHMLVEALFWFHPLVWWIGARLIEERERACDEEVLRLGNQPNIYAESILKTCQFYLESPLVCVSGITGSDLKKRIVRVMSHGLTARLSFRKKLLLVGAGIAALAVPLAVGLTNGSQPESASAPSFEAASIKPTKSGTPGLFRISLEPGGRFVANGVNVSTLIQIAYNVKENQISGAPSWFNSDRFDIQAKPDDAAAAEMQKLPLEQRGEQSRQMLQSLLADRFKLKLGHETKELSVYLLTVAKNGPRFHESATPNHQGAAGSGPPRAGIMMNGRGQLTVTDAKLEMFANVLSHQLGRIVLDKTGLSGKYDFTLHWTPGPNEGPMMPGPGPGPDREGPGGAPPPPEQSGPSLFTALQEQLGLKLESQKAPVDILVVEHVERPSEN
jgi:uncharacterized protein (TIGR03435 family)